MVKPANGAVLVEWFSILPIELLLQSLPRYMQTHTVWTVPCYRTRSEMRDRYTVQTQDE